MIKRAFDLAAALVGLALLLPVFALVAVLVKLDSKGPVLFRQERMGKGFKPFIIYKFRTMAANAGASLTSGHDPRITRLGAALRRTKIDELPQLVNVVLGQMSLVGPRPEVRKYAELFRKDYEEILKVKPGVTDLASFQYRDEAKVLGGLDPEKIYLSRVLPDKIRLAKEYIQRSSFLFDFTLLVRTVLSLLLRR
ncbi:MAG: sugar transferase [Elusimicrobia bacterium]|nr:sugar transferase [Elusimicrobiota bacterium]